MSHGRYTGVWSRSGRTRQLTRKGPHQVEREKLPSTPVNVCLINAL